MQQGTSSCMAIVLCLFIAGTGCAGLAETARGIAGVSTKVLEDGRKSVAKKSYPVTYATCRETVDYVLSHNNVYIYARNEQKKMVAFYLSETDTTPVGVFFTVQGDAVTEVSVSSPSRYAKEFIVDKISARFDKVLRADQGQAAAGSPSPEAAIAPGKHEASK